MSPVHQVWPIPSCKAQRKGEEDKADRLEEEVGGQNQGPGLKFAKSQRAVENKEKWRKLFVKLSVVPQ